MDSAELLYYEIASKLIDAQQSKMFGAKCIKAPNGKSGVMFYKGKLVCKLNKELAEKVLQLSGTQVFTPSELRPPMNGWYELPYDHHDIWEYYAQIAHEEVKKMIVIDKKQKK